MAHVITRLCVDCVDGACVDVCPVDCIVAHRPPSGASDLPNQLFIDPSECTDCGMCQPACPWVAIYPDDEVPEAFADDIALNAQSARRDEGFVVLRTKKDGAPAYEEVQANRQRWGLVR
ncbi:MAG TPA: ferredoxin family protein [Polyangiaceae bacterium]|jgi:ferredoxin|nr:ferredoxin family protein [Polyangiaceae bacterium]